MRLPLIAISILLAAAPVAAVDLPGAVVAENDSLITALLEAGADVEATLVDYHGATALMLAAERDAPPTASELAAARQRVGADRISVVSGEGVSLGEIGMKLDLGGIAKGYALDRMLPLLERHEIESALLNFGQSSTWAVGAPVGSAGWRLLIRGPEGRMAGLITLRDQALSVSGSQGQWVEIGGRRYGHIIDPRSGDPLMRSRRPSRLLSTAAVTATINCA